MVSKYPPIYGVMAMIDKKDYKFVSKYKTQLSHHIQFYMKKEHFGHIAPQHISMCYFSYPKKYPKKFIKKLIPHIIEISRKYLPIKIKVKGLKGGWEVGMESPTLAGHESPLIMWNITNFKEINLFHKNLIKELKIHIKHFNDPDLEFTPHIGVALGKDSDLGNLKTIVKNSKKDDEIELNISSLQIYFSTGPEEVYRKRM